MKPKCKKQAICGLWHLPRRRHQLRILGVLIAKRGSVQKAVASCCLNMRHVCTHENMHMCTYTTSRLSGRPLVSVGHVEVVQGKTRPEDYPEALAQFSLVIFTPRTERKDPCVEMRKRFSRHKKK